MKRWRYITIRQSSGFMGGGLYYTLPGENEKKYSGGDDKGLNLNKLLNYFGEKGYELVDSATSATHVGIYNRFWVLKRQTQD